MRARFFDTHGSDVTNSTTSIPADYMVQFEGNGFVIRKLRSRNLQYESTRIGDVYPTMDAAIMALRLSIL